MLWSNVTAAKDGLNYLIVTNAEESKIAESK
jgi:hypothetical protein